MFRPFQWAVLLGVLSVLPAPALAQASNMVMSGSYSSPGVNPGGQVDLVFSLYTQEYLSQSVQGAGFTYTVPTGLQVTGVTGSSYCPGSVSHAGQVITVSGVSQTPSFVCQITAHLSASTDLVTYELEPTMLSFTAPVAGTFEMVGGSNPTLTVTNAPVIASMSPRRGDNSGGETIVITGTSFLGVSSVTFGGVPASFVVDSATQITVTTPPGTNGQHNVSITALGGSSLVSSSSTFTYMDPIPTLTEWAMILLATVLAGVGALFVQRRRTV